MRRRGQGTAGGRLPAADGHGLRLTNGVGPQPGGLQGILRLAGKFGGDTAENCELLGVELVDEVTPN